MSKPDFSDYAHEIWPQVVAAKSIEAGAALIADALRSAYAAASPEVVLGMLDRIAEQEADSKALGELLAVIHRDGGQYQEEKGTKQAVEDAHAVWAALVAERDEAREAVRRLAGALEKQQELYARRIPSSPPQSSGPGWNRKFRADIGLDPDACGCHRCIGERDERGPGGAFPLSSCMMILCPICGNKRCPHANDHRHVCTNSNEPGQPGSAY
jgi:hypothetical protein